MAVLYYVHDPMCSWCWGFEKTWSEIRQQLPEEIDVRYVVGGLAPDDEEVMPEAMQRFLQQTWRRIAQTIPGTVFNHAFWSECTPRRSTYPACRAVLAAKQCSEKSMTQMITAIQHAYYLDAKNPSDVHVLVQLAESIGLDPEGFHADICSKTINKMLSDDIALARLLGAQGFPSLIFEDQKGAELIPLSYTNAEVVLQHERLRIYQ